eukprot:CAMPEP_0197897304 /NCGR_PEP_ID=MMETSP1439-20131203/42111_1 /TAXON_ID=66791 /ORGANISM="Gonyaulax spinifera, Strain CCMP409" /LENGTH=157 /DNA_ID=CAMNT_0043517925 /DNA_START=123 /DNA_END=596 /DNA_ORIENTATION=+
MLLHGGALRGHLHPVLHGQWGVLQSNLAPPPNLGDVGARGAGWPSQTSVSGPDVEGVLGVGAFVNFAEAAGRCAGEFQSAVIYGQRMEPQVAGLHVQWLLRISVPCDGPERPVQLSAAVRDRLLDEELLGVLEARYVRRILAHTLANPEAFEVLHEP